jgi:hypothetical protein
MRILVVFAILALAPITMAIQNQPSGAQARKDAQKANPATPTSENCNCADNTSDSKNNPPWWHKFVAWPEGIATSALIFTLIAIGWQSWETRKAAKAAALGIQISISKECFRIKVRPPDHWNFPVDFDASTQQAILQREHWQGVMYDVHCYGLTEGYILEAFDGACVSDSQDAPPLTVSPIHNLPWRIDPTNPEQIYWRGEARMLKRMESLEDATAVIEGRKFIHFWGRIRYRDVFFDVFRKERETSWRWVWKFTGNAGDTAIMTPLGGRFGKWEQCGSPEDNRET